MNKTSRYLLLSVIFAAASTVVSARPDTYHTPRDGDRMHPGIASSRSLIMSVNDSTKTALLDPSAISFDDERDASAYIDTDTISYVQFATGTVSQYV